MDNVGFGMDAYLATGSTSTTHPGATGTLCTVAADDYDQIVIPIPVVAITGNPQITVAWGLTSGGSFTVEKTFTLDNTYNGKTALVQILKPIQPFYRISIALNGGTISIALQPATPIRYGPRRRPVPASGATTVVLTQVAGNS
jgi:hypothetical protein